jgi:hypothetical protein
VQYESSDAKSFNNPSESQAQVADLGENDAKKGNKRNMMDGWFGTTPSQLQLNSLFIQ